MLESMLRAGVKSCGSKMVEVSGNVEFPLVTITDLGRHRLSLPTNDH